MEQQYLKGKRNFLIRTYFYLTNGLALVNDFRNLGLGIFALYFALKLTNPWLMVLMFTVSIAILIPTGHFMVHKVSKVKEWLATKFGSHYAIQNFDYVKEQFETLKRIERLLQDQATFMNVAKKLSVDKDLAKRGLVGSFDNIPVFVTKKKK